MANKRPTSVRNAAEAQKRRNSAMLKLAGIAAAVVAALAFLLQLNFGMTGGVGTIGLNETETLKDIFFGGSPWLIQCIGPGISLDSTFAAAAPHLAANKEPYSVVKTAAIPCGDKLPSGKTVYERFKLNPQTNPLVALFANGEKPQVVSRDALEMPATLVKRVSEASKLRLFDVSTPSSFGRACLSKMNKLCVMVFPYTPLSAEHNATLRAVASAYRTIQFAVINIDNVEISLERSLPARDETEQDTHLRVAVSRVFPDNSAQALAYRGPFAEAELKAWLAELASSETELNMLSKKPSASRRRRARDPNEDEATRQERRRRRKAERKAAEDALRAATEEALRTLSPEERVAREAELRARQVEWERKRREQMQAEEGSSSIFDYDDDDEDDEDEGDEGEEAVEEVREEESADVESGEDEAE